MEIRFKPSDVGTVIDGAITDIKVNAAANITMSKLNLAITDSEVAGAAGIVKSKLAALDIVNADVDAGAAIDMSKLTLAITNTEVDAAASIVKSKLAALDIVDDDVDSIGVGKVTGAVDGRKESTTGDKDVLAIGWDDVTEEVIVDHEV